MTDRTAMLQGLGLILVAGALFSGCSIWPLARPETDLLRITEDEFAAALNDFTDGFSDQVQDAASSIIELVEDRQVRRRTVQWKITSIGDCRRAVLDSNQRLAWSNLYALCVQLRVFFENGAGTIPEPIFGAGQSIAVDTMRQQEFLIRKLGERAFPEALTPEILRGVESFAHDHPATGAFVRDAFRLESATSEQKNALLVALAVPLRPFQVFEGIDQGAQAISELARVADRFVSSVQELPERSRWQVELLSYELENLETITTTVTELQAVAASARSLAATAENLPAELRKTLDQTFAELDERHAGLETLLAATRDTVGEFRGVAESAERLAASSKQVAANLGEAGRAWEGTFSALRDITGTAADRLPAPGQEDESFDITRYGDAAREYAGAATELKGMLEELRGLIASQELPAATADLEGKAQATIGLTAAEARGLADHVAWRAGQLLMLLFALALVYRLIARCKIRTT